MTEILTSVGGKSRRRSSDRLFFAIIPDPPTAARIERLAHHLCQVYGLKGRPIAPHRLHMTLHFLGHYEELSKDLVAAATNAADRLSWPEFDLGFDRIDCFSDRPAVNRPVVLRSSDESAVAVGSFQYALGDALRATGLSAWIEPVYVPHVTLLYDERRVVEQLTEPIAWTAHEFVLIHSLVSEARHVVLGRWSLRG